MKYLISTVSGISVLVSSCLGSPPLERTEHTESALDTPAEAVTPTTEHAPPPVSAHHSASIAQQVKMLQAQNLQIASDVGDLKATDQIIVDGIKDHAAKIQARLDDATRDRSLIHSELAGVKQANETVRAEIHILQTVVDDKADRHKLQNLETEIHESASTQNAELLKQVAALEAQVQALLEAEKKSKKEKSATTVTQTALRVPLVEPVASSRVLHSFSVAGNQTGVLLEAEDGGLVVEIDGTTHSVMQRYGRPCQHARILRHNVPTLMYGDVCFGYLAHNESVPGVGTVHVSGYVVYRR